MQKYRIVEDSGPRGPWKVETIAYYYALEAESGREILAYHWHPDTGFPVTTPHMHLGPEAAVGHQLLAQSHLPTGRISMEDVLRLAITDFHVEPNRPDWEDVLAGTQAAYFTWRTWA